MFLQVVIIQACRTTSHTLLPSEYFDAAVPPCETTHITLTRPHTVLLLATSEGQPARRGAFTAAIAAQIMTADGRKDISSMFDLAVREMIPDARFEYEQIPEMRKTTSKHSYFLQPCITQEYLTGTESTCGMYVCFNETTIFLCFCV